MSSYRYRGLPFCIAPDSELWCVCGIDDKGGAGVLEWCYDEHDALFVLSQMSRFPQFRNLSAEQHLAERDK